MTTQISGDTGVSQCQPGSVSQDDLAANVVGNGPAFSVGNTGVQTVSTSTPTRLLFPIKAYDTHKAFSTDTSLFTAPIGGYYLLTATCWMTGGTPYISIYINGAEHRRGAQGTASCCVSSLVYISAGQSVEIVVYQASGGNLNTSPGTPTVHFQGFLARAA